MIVIDDIMVKAGYIDKLKEILKEQDLGFAIFDKVNFEPTITVVDEGLKPYKEQNCNFLIAIGGESPIDTAEAMKQLCSDVNIPSNPYQD